jgi:hypothetical protein
VVLETFRRNVVAEDPSVSDSALRRQQAEMLMSAAAQNSDRNLQLASQSGRLRARLQVSRAARKKEGKALMVNNLMGRHHQEVEHPLLAERQQEVERPLQPSALRGSQSAARKSLKKNHHRPGHNNVICDSGSGRKDSGAAFLSFVTVQRLSPKLFSRVML